MEYLALLAPGTIINIIISLLSIGLSTIEALITTATANGNTLQAAAAKGFPC